MKVRTTMADRVEDSAFSKWAGLAKLIAIIVPVIGAAPTAVNVYYGWKYDIPWWQVPQRAEQARLWERNAECKFNYRPISTGAQTVVHIGSCPTTGDIALKVSAKDRDPVYSWISYEALPKPGQSMSFIEHLVPPLRAAEAGAKMSNGLRVAQSAITIVCQYRQGANIVRIVREGNQCYREMFSPFQGRVLKRDVVPCTTRCPAA
jgi:hypothetical protein